MSLYQTALPERRLIEISGADRVDFLQNLVTQNVDALQAGNCVMAALLTPQGKLLYDFIIYAETDKFLLDVSETIAEALMKKLTLYKLRADIELSHSGKEIHTIWQEDGYPCPPMAGFYEDPRHEGLGLRGFFDTAPETGLPTAPAADWHKNRLKLAIAEGPADMPPGTVFPLEYGFGKMHAIDFKKGCFVGQEVTSRTHRKGSLRKKLHAVALAEADGTPGDKLMVGQDTQPRAGGELVARHEHIGLALIREDAVNETLTLNGHAVSINGSLFDPQTA